MLLDDGPTDFRALAQHVYEARVLCADRLACILDGDFLVVDQHGHDGGDVDFAPAVGDVLVALLDVAHRGLELLLQADFEVFFHLVGGCGIFLLARVHGELGIAAQDLGDVLIRIDMVCDEVEVAVDMLDEVLKRLVDLVLGIAGARRQFLAVDVEAAALDGFGYVARDARFEFCGIVLLDGEDALDRRGLLLAQRDVDELLDAHGLFQQLVVTRGFGEHDDGPAF